MAHLEAGQKLGSENVTASTMTLVPGCGNRMIVPSEKKEKIGTNEITITEEIDGQRYFISKFISKFLSLHLTDPITDC